jgi:DNA-binding transcriptional LysR family regulator
VTLLVRHRTGVTLTPAGEVLADRARAAVDAVEAGIDRARERAACA